MNPSPESTAAPDPAFVLLFDTLPEFDIGLIADGIRACEPLKQDVTYELEAEGEPGFSAHVMFDDHQVHLVGLSAPLPKSVFEQAVNGSRFHPKLTKEMEGQRAHIVCYYQGRSTDPVEQLMALEKIALAFLPMGVLGLLDSGAWNCRPRMLMEKFNLKLLRGTIAGEPHMLSLGFVKVFKDDGVWFCTKGQHRFGLPDFAWLATLNEAQPVYDALGKLFLHFRDSGTRPQAGETADLGGGQQVRFREVYEFSEWLDGPGGTLVVESANQFGAVPVLTQAASGTPTKSGGKATKILLGAGIAVGGIILLLVLGIGLLFWRYSPRRQTAPRSPTSQFPPPSAPRGGATTTNAPRFIGPPVFLRSKHATFTDLQGNQYNDVVLTIADGRGLSYYKIGGRPGTIPFTNLPTEFLVGLGVPTNWPGVLK